MQGAGEEQSDFSDAELQEVLDALFALFEESDRQIDEPKHHPYAQEASDYVLYWYLSGAGQYWPDSVLQIRVKQQIWDETQPKPQNPASQSHSNPHQQDCSKEKQSVEARLPYPVSDYEWEVWQEYYKDYCDQGGGNHHRQRFTDVKWQSCELSLLPRIGQSSGIFQGSRINWPFQKHQAFSQFLERRFQRVECYFELILVLLNDSLQLVIPEERHELISYSGVAHLESLLAKKAEHFRVFKLQVVCLHRSDHQKTGSLSRNLQ